MTRYGEATTILGRLPSGLTVTISLYKASDGSSVDLNDNTCTEIGSTGVYRWSSSNITTQPTEETEYFYRMVTGDYQYDGKFTLLADIPTVEELNARTLLAADYFDPAADTVAHVTLVDTTTTNTDMRGTDNAAIESNVETHVTNSLNTYDPPTRAEATSDKDEIINEVNANETKIDAIPSNTDTQLSGTHGSGSWEGVSGADWTANEKKQIRDALGVDGDKIDAADSRIVDDIKKHDNKITGLLM